MKRIAAIFLFLALPMFARADSQWVLKSSTLAYHVTHPLHEVEGVSHSARGEGKCHAGQCDFLVAATVKSFNSGDSNRDLHMLQVTKGAEFPIITVRFHLPESALSQKTIHCDLRIHFAGQVVTYKQVAFQQTIQGNEHHITGTIPATVSDFKINPPKLLMVPIHNQIPIDVDMTWQKE